MISSDALARMRQQNIKEINKDDLVDIRSVVVDTSLPPEQRMMDYLEKSKSLLLSLWGCGCFYSLCRQGEQS